ncbi:MAG: plasmid mobilization relaxosome protein MobC [Labilibaculum antarcticum]
MRPKTNDIDVLDEWLHLRMSKFEKRMLRKRCKEEGYRTLSDFCRAKLVKKREIRKIEVSEEFVLITKKLDYQLNKIGVNLNQVSKNINAQQVHQFGAADREVFLKVLQELRNCFSVLQNYMDVIE